MSWIMYRTYVLQALVQGVVMITAFVINQKSGGVCSIRWTIPHEVSALFRK